MTFFNPDRARYDALAHFVYGGAYPKRHPGIARDFKQTGPLMPALLRFGILAPSGVLAYRGGRFGPDGDGNLFISYFNTHSVTRVGITPDGATYRAVEEPFLNSPSADFDRSGDHDAGAAMRASITGQCGWRQSAGAA
jgi:hypothetical protein